MNSKPSIGSILLLIFAFFVYSSSGVFTKLASRVDFLSYKYLLYFSAVIVLLGIYAILWQIVLKNVPLTKAFLFKSMTVMFALLFAHFIFEEVITWQNLFGASFIISGIILNALNTSKL